MDTALIKTLQLIVALSLLVVLHEGGHFFFSKLFGVKVEKFFLFFDAWGFKLFSSRWLGRWFPRLRKNETEYGIGWLPFGGYVKISGMIDESMDTEQMKQPPKPHEFRTKPAWQRLLIMTGGVLVNLLLAFFIYAMVLYTWGESYIRPQDMTYGLQFSEQAKADGFRDGDVILLTDGDSVRSFSTNVLRDISNARTVTVLRSGQEVTLTMPEHMSLLDMISGESPYADYLNPMNIDSITPGSPAEKAGIRKGDRITAINGNAITTFNDLVHTLNHLAKPFEDEQVQSTAQKTARQVTLVVNGTDTVRTELTEDFKLGISNRIATADYHVTERAYGFFESFPAGISYGWETLSNYVSDLKYIFTKKGANSVGGFVTMGKIFPDTWDWFKFWNLTAFLSIILAFMNILPIPALDGGHVLFLLYEIITRRQPSEKFLERAQMIGMILLFGLLIWANGNDILRLLGVIQ